MTSDHRTAGRTLIRTPGPIPPRGPTRELSLSALARTDGDVMVSVVGRLDAGTAGQFRAALSRILNGVHRRAGTTVIVDLAGASHLDPAGVAVLAASRQVCEQLGLGWRLMA